MLKLGTQDLNYIQPYIYIYFEHNNHKLTSKVPKYVSFVQKRTESWTGRIREKMEKRKGGRKNFTKREEKVEHNQALLLPRSLSNAV